MSIYMSICLTKRDDKRKKKGNSNLNLHIPLSIVN